MSDIDSAVSAILARLHPPQLADIDLSLDRVRSLMQILDHPERRLPPVVHVAGTNGKGSLLAYLQAIMMSAGYRVHRYTSPHLVRFNERISLSGNAIDDTALLSFLQRVERATERCPATFFEATTAAAYLAFSEHPADILLLETGLGGRLDATNIVDRPLLTAITPVDDDHREFLGDTITKIAGEKAGIIKDHTPCVVGKQSTEVASVIEHAAQEHHAPLFRCGEEWHRKEHDYVSSQWRVTLTPSLSGAFQYDNAATAVACAEMLLPHFPLLTQGHVERGVYAARWPARLQKLERGTLSSLLHSSQELWLDGGHNPHAGHAIAQWLMQKQFSYVHVVCGMINGKDTQGFLQPLAPYVDSFYAVEIPGELSSQSANNIVVAAHDAGIASIQGVQSVSTALDEIARSQISGCVLICGSLYLAGKVLEMEGNGV